MHIHCDFQLNHKSASVPELENEAFKHHNSSNKLDVSSLWVYTEQTEASQSMTSVEVTPILSYVHLQPAASCTVNPCKLTAVAVMKTKPEVTDRDSLLYSELHGDAHPAKSCNVNLTCLPIKPQATASPAIRYLNTPVSPLMDPLTLKDPPTIGFKTSKGEGNQCTLPETTLTQTWQSETKAAKEEKYTKLDLEAPTPAGQITSFIKEMSMLSEPGEEKRLSRKTRRALEKEQKMTNKEKQASSECTKTEQIQLLPNGTIIEHLQSLKLETMTPKHTLETAAANQVNQNIKLGTSLNHILFSIVSVPTKSPDLASGNMHVDPLGYPNLAWLSESP